MGNFQNYWSQNVGQDFIVLDFFHGRKILKVDGRDGRDPQNREKNAPAERFTCMFHRCFLPSFSSFGWGFSEEKIKMWKVSKQMTDDGHQVMPKAHIAFGKVC
jgi:hypothetical protein